MARDPLAAVSAFTTPQNRRMPGRSDQVRNSGGGHVFAKDLWTRVEDFLILGTTGGTYYVGEDRLTAENVAVLFEAIAQDGPRVVAMLTEISTARPPRAPKNRPALFALAACYARGDADTRQAATAALTKVARTTDHLAQFFGHYKNQGGKPTSRGVAPVAGRSLRTALGSWLLQGTPDDVAFRACKAAQRRTPQGESFSMRDVLRIAHPVADSKERATLFGWIAGNVSDDEARDELPAIDRFLTAKAVTTAEQAVRVVTEAGVPWEFLPDAMLREPVVWDALVGTVGMTALLRNLARMTRIGTLGPRSGATRRAVARLTDAGALLRARIHPMDAWLAMRVYASGHSRPDARAKEHRWEPVPAILDALEETYELSFGGVEPTGKRLLVAVDSSGSMQYQPVIVGGSRIGTPYEVANAMAVMLCRLERGGAHVIDVDTAVHRSRVTRRTNLREIVSWRPSGGGTNLALPFDWARRKGFEADGVVVLTDNETWAGDSHPAQALDAYRAAVNPDARVVVAAMTAAGHTIGDPRDAGVLNVAGLDASLPLVVNGFFR
ncbi:TROVE domain-containing protein [Spongiactinospora sp. TRM90649]|uniref:TROVE domain-containing protein n=1 Tax=Spongiactinospora sp. TRM90649 TaxID=3031114 RepID=UPI0023F771F5|nr:TROVE domain-containing protein [Spongiactinospora sp. TRM90649]MDF5758165.1 TROVE domain-containing protein [Spongiactinospora sp. TRM90649]